MHHGKIKVGQKYIFKPLGMEDHPFYGEWVMVTEIKENGSIVSHGYDGIYSQLESIFRRDYELVVK